MTPVAAPPSPLTPVEMGCAMKHSQGDLLVELRLTFGFTVATRRPRVPHLFSKLLAHLLSLPGRSRKYNGFLLVSTGFYGVIDGFFFWANLVPGTVTSQISINGAPQCIKRPCLDKFGPVLLSPHGIYGLDFEEYSDMDNKKRQLPQLHTV